MNDTTALVQLVSDWEDQRGTGADHTHDDLVARLDALRDAVREATAARLGTCPACGEDVTDAEQDVTYTCPADLVGNNPYRLDSVFSGETDEQREARYQRAQVWSDCGEDFGVPCHDPLPLHAACHERGNY